MYSPTLEELINSVVAEGKLSPTAETLLRKRAEKEGEDPDEVIFFLHGQA